MPYLQSRGENHNTPINSTDAHADTDYLTITEHQTTPLPNQDHLPFWEKEWIAPELKDLLFKQHEVEDEVNSTPLRTYLVVDAYLYTKIRGFFDLDLINDVPVKCLFKGEAEESMKTVAPYLIDMTLPEGAWKDKSKVSNFHKYYFENQWGKGTGIFVRSATDMEEIYQHFRKFTKVQDEKGKWYFFRFYDPRSFMQIVRSLSTANTQYFFANIQCIICPNKNTTAHISVQQSSSGETPPAPIIFNETLRKAMGLQRKQQFAQSMQKLLEKKYTSFCELDDDHRKDFILTALTDAEGYGIALERSLGYFMLTKWIKQYDWNQWIKQQMAALNNTALSEIDKMRRLYAKAQEE